MRRGTSLFYELCWKIFDDYFFRTIAYYDGLKEIYRGK